MAIPPESEWHRLPRKRAVAMAQGAAHYFTGKPCKRGHVVPRPVAGFCPICLRDYVRDYVGEHRDYFNAKAREYRADPEYRKAENTKLRERRANDPAYRDTVNAKNSKRRAESIRELSTEGHYSNMRETQRNHPSRSPEARREETRQRRAKRRTGEALRFDRRPPNKQDKASRAELKALEDAIRARGNHPDHIVPFQHPRLRGLHTLANLQELTPRQNCIKGNRILTAAQIRRELETGIRTPEPSEAELTAMVDGGLAIWPEDVDEDYEHTSTPGKVNWANYPQHTATENE